MKEEQFNPLPSQGTIYSTSRLGNHLIIGTGDYGKVFAHISNTQLQRIPLQNMSHESDVISVDAYIDSFPVLAVAFLQKSTANVPGAMADGRGKGFVTSHLNIYSTWISTDQDSPTSLTSSGSSSGGGFRKQSFLPKEEFHSSQFELLAQNCTAFLLDFIPYQLYHVPVLKQNGTFGNVLLLTGSDRTVHAFESDDYNLTFLKVPIKSYFPELSQLFPNVVTRLLIQPVNEVSVKRITLCGLETGSLLVWIVSSKLFKENQSNAAETTSEAEAGGSSPFQSKNLSMASSLTDEFDNIFDQPGIFDVTSDDKSDDTGSEVAQPLGESDCMSNSFDCGDEVFEKIEHYYDGLITSIRSYSDGFNLNVIVASALSPTFVYSNVIEERFTLGTPLKFSSRWDCVQCCCVEDVDRDGENEIIIGTFGCTVLVYKYMDEILPEWVIVSKKKFPSCILSIEFVSPFLHVVSGLGLHIVEYNTSAYFTNKPGVVEESSTSYSSDSSITEDIVDETTENAQPSEIKH